MTTAAFIQRISARLFSYRSNLIIQDNTASVFNYAYSSIEQILVLLDSSAEGLTADVAADRLYKNGLNTIKPLIQESWWQQLWQSYKTPFNLLLTVIMLLEMTQHELMYIILAMIIIATLMHYFSEKRTKYASNQLHKTLEFTTSVIRKINNISTQQEICSSQLVIGDVIKLAAGDMLMADVRILSSKNLFISQASLTGEANAVLKTTSTSIVSNVLELKNIAFMGTDVLHGTALGVIIATAKDTMFGKITNRLNHKQQSKLQIELANITRKTLLFMLIMSALVFVCSGTLTHQWHDAILLAMAVAVGLTPEMLPLIISSTLARGSLILAKSNVIVKKLDALHDFGAMNILCLDKTGTLTQDNVYLERHTDIYGNVCQQVLDIAYLNSHHQTGFKNLIDTAILAKYNVISSDIMNKFHKIDELPFDFQRRRMSVILQDKEEKLLLICKGAVAELLSCCSSVMIDQHLIPLTIDLQAQITVHTAALACDGLRVLAVATKNLINTTNADTDLESNLTLHGYISVLDPPKDTASAALKIIQEYGVTIKILTGDDSDITHKLCRNLDINATGILLGSAIDSLTDSELVLQATANNIFAKLTPLHKERIVRALQQLPDNVVGFMGDGINDVPALKAADVGISVSSSVAIAKTAADIILLEKNLLVLGMAIGEGRKTIVNMAKYLRITASANFGNVLSLLLAALFIPFLAILPLQLLLQNMIYDASQLAIPFLPVRKEQITSPQRWKITNMYSFIIRFGVLSSIFDVLTFLLLWLISRNDFMQSAHLFQSGWFVEGLLTQALAIHLLGDREIPILQMPLSLLTSSITLVVFLLGVTLPYSSIAYNLKLQPLPVVYFIGLSVIIGLYICCTQFLKKIYIKKYGW